jgi:hypothetical protein
MTHLAKSLKEHSSTLRPVIVDTPELAEFYAQKGIPYEYAETYANHGKQVQIYMAMLVLAKSGLLEDDALEAILDSANWHAESTAGINSAMYAKLVALLKENPVVNQIPKKLNK